MSDAESRTPDQIRADIESTREELGETVEALSAKTDVKARAQDKKEEVKANVRASVDEAQAKVKDALPGGDSVSGETPPAAEKAQELGGAAASAARDNVLPLAIAGALILGYLIGRRAAR